MNSKKTKAARRDIQARTPSPTSLGERRRKLAVSKLSMSLDYLFGTGSSEGIDYDALDFQFSRKTGRLRYVLDKKRTTENKNVLFTLRPNGSIAPTIEGAKLLLLSSYYHSKKTGKRRRKRLENRPRWVVTVLDEVSEFIAEGKTVFCRHVVSCSDELRAGEDVAVLSERGNLLAVGTSVVSGGTMKQFKRGVAVKTREGSKGNPNGSAAFV